MAKMNWKQWKASGEEEQDSLSRKQRKLLVGHANGGPVKRFSQAEIDKLNAELAKKTGAPKGK